MLFREYEEKDAKTIVSWLNDEYDFYLWSGDMYNHYPITAEELASIYALISKKGLFKPMMLEDNGVIVAHIVLRTLEAGKKVIRLSFIISNDKLRGKGYGRAVTLAAIDYARNKLGAEEIDLGVFANNDRAIALYKSLGFEFVPDDGKEVASFEYKGKKWEYAKMAYKK